MKIVRIFLLSLISALTFCYGDTLVTCDVGKLAPGRFYVGFQILEKYDLARSTINNLEHGDDNHNSRPMRIYIWYPTFDGKHPNMHIDDFINMAANDFSDFSETVHADQNRRIPPVPMQKGLSEKSLTELRAQSMLSKQDAAYSKEEFPVIIVGQGLYYESPLTHLILCEYLASHGFVVVTCPLKGTQHRLVNLNVIDLETAVRDLEYSLSEALKLSFSSKHEIGVIGYDLGGMAAMILSMRNPEIDAFISLDAGIIYPHYSGLPNNHPNYDLSNFHIPWMHVTQSRIVPGGMKGARPSNVMKQKVYGDNYLFLLNTTNHASFTSYAIFGMENPVLGYWGENIADFQPIYEAVCDLSRNFLDAYLRDNEKSLEYLNGKAGLLGDIGTFEIEKAPKPVISKDFIINKFIEDGSGRAVDYLNGIDKAVLKGLFPDASELNWLGYHFLYWWNRGEEAVLVFEFITELFPESANAFDSLAEAFMLLNEKGKAIKFYNKSLELDPENENAKQMIKELSSIAQESLF